MKREHLDTDWIRIRIRNSVQNTVSLGRALHLDLKVDNGLILLEVDILIGAEVLREGNAGEILAPLALARRHRVEHGEQGRVDQERGQQAAADENQALCPLAAAAPRPLEWDVGHEGVGEEEAGEKADDVGVVVHPGQQAQQQQQAQD